MDAALDVIRTIGTSAGVCLTVLLGVYAFPGDVTPDLN